MGSTDVSARELVIENLDHLGIVAGVVDQIGLVECIDARLGRYEGEHISAGQAMKAMILNGLGFVSAPLYLFGRFFEGKPTEHLLGAGVEPEHLNDDKLGRVLDGLYEAGLSSLFVEVASEAMSRLGVSTQRLHLDATSFHLHGRYPQQHQQGQQETVVESEQTKPEPIHITYGYSRDHRPDLKQFVVDLLCSGDGGIPVFLRAGDGNDSDAASFANLIGEFRQQVGFEAMFVADAALYGEHNLQTLKELSWVSRVPLTLKEARAVLEETDEQSSRPSGREGYTLLAEMRTDYAGIFQRWVIVSSEGRAERVANQIDRRVAREEAQGRVELRKLKRRSFNCESDAREELSGLDERLRFHRLQSTEVTSEPYYARRGRPRKGESPHYRYRITAEVVRDEEAVHRARRRAGRFMLATNVLDEEGLPAEEVLEAYLEQGVVERGFRFLKDPMFFAQSVFLKSPKRVAALAMVMGLCLLVYALGERMLRQSLAEREDHIWDQKGKPTQRPTLRWVFQLFQAVHLVWMGVSQQVAGLSAERRHILESFSPQCRGYYLLS
jgi:transposase